MWSQPSSKRRRSTIRFFAKHQQIGRGVRTRDDRDYLSLRFNVSQPSSEQSREHARASRDSGNVQEIHFTGCASSHLHGGCTTGSRSDGTTTIGHSLATRSFLQSTGSTWQCDVQPSSSSAGEPHPSALIKQSTNADQVQMRYPFFYVTSHPVKHDIIDGGYKRSDERPINQCIHGRR